MPVYQLSKLESGWIKLLQIWCSNKQTLHVLLDVDAPSDFVIKCYFGCIVFVHVGSKRSQTESYIRDHVASCEVNNSWIIQLNTGKNSGSLFVLLHTMGLIYKRFACIKSCDDFSGTQNVQADLQCKDLCVFKMSRKWFTLCSSDITTSEIRDGECTN